VNDLVDLDPDIFDRREYVALRWVRSFLTTPEGVPVEIDEEFCAEFTPEERTHVIASMKGMFIFNLLVNTQRYLTAKLRGESDAGAGAACPL